MKRRRRLLVQGVIFLLLGAVLTVAVAWALAMGVDVTAGPVRSASSAQGESQWTVTRWDRPGATLILSVRETGRSWSASQATGAPDTPGAGDIPTAWATATPDGQPEWLELRYAEPVVAVRSIQVHETCSPGAVVRITAFGPDGKEVQAWRDPAGAPRPDATGQPRRVLDLPVSLDFPVSRVKVYIDSPNVPGWNEIDAVGLVDAAGQAHWAAGATASSVYGSYGSGGTGGGAEALVAPYAGLLESASPAPATPPPTSPTGRVLVLTSSSSSSTAASVGSPGPPALLRVYGGYGNGGATRLTARAIHLRGWPMLALCCEAPPVAPGTTAPGPPGIPLRPVWAGFLVDTLVFAGLLAPVWWGLTVPRRFVREVGRMRRGCCITCGYDLGYDFVRGCPECGWRRADDHAARPYIPDDGHATVAEGLITTETRRHGDTFDESRRAPQRTLVQQEE